MYTSRPKTGSEKAGNARMDSIREWHTTFDAIKDPIALIDLNCRILRCNKAMAQFTNKSFEKILGQKSPLPKKLLKRVQASLKREVQTVEKNGRWLYYAIDPLMDEKGRLKGGVQIITDITERKRFEQKLKESEERYRNLIQLAPDAILTFDMNGVVTSCNNATAKLSGYAKKDFIGKHLSELECFRHQDIPRYLKVFNMIKKKRLKGPFELNWHSKKGTLYKTEVLFSMIRKDKKNVGIQIIARDITKHKQLEYSLKTRERYLSGLSAITSLFLESKDLDNTLKIVMEILRETTGADRCGLFEVFSDDHNHLHAHHKFEAFGPGCISRNWTGNGKDSPWIKHCLRPWSKKLAKGEPIYGTRDAFSLQEQKVLKTQKVQTLGIFPLRVQNAFYGFLRFDFFKGGIPFNTQQLILMEAISNEIGAALERREADRALKESEQKYRNLFENANDAIYLVEPKTIKIIDCNRKAAKLDGFTTDQLKQMVYLDLHPENERNKIAKEFQDIYENGSESVISRLHHSKKGGRSVPVEINSTLIDFEGFPFHLIIVRDLTERKKSDKKLEKAYAELEKAQQSLIQSEKMAALGSLSSNIAHEIKNPLGIILGGIEFVSRKLEKTLPHKDEDIEIAIQKIKESVFRADTFIHGLLKFAKPSELKFEEIDIDKLIEETLFLIKYRYPMRNINIHRDSLLLKGMKIFADKNQMQQVLFNLFTNAVEAMPKGGDLRVKTYLTKPSEFSPEGTLLAIEISDTGVGIAKEDLKRVFEPYFTKKGDKRGTGLGLPTAQMIVNNHNGDLTIESKIGQGTKVKTTLPLRQKELRKN